MNALPVVDGYGWRAQVGGVWPGAETAAGKCIQWTNGWFVVDHRAHVVTYSPFD